MDGYPGGPPAASVPEPPSDPVDRLPLPQWGVAGAVALTLLMIAATIGGGFVAAWIVTLEIDTDLQAVGMGLALSLPYLIALGAVALVARYKGLSLAQGVGLRRVPLWEILPLALAVGFGARLFAGMWGLLLTALGIELPGSNIDPTSLLPPGLAGVTFTVLAACILAPLAEEIVFRGILLPALAERWGVAAGVGLSSAAFAAVHIYPFAMVPIFALAIVLARLFLRSRTLWLPVVAHSLFNAIGIAAVYALKATGRL